MTLNENVLTERSRGTHSESTGMCHHVAAATFTTRTPYLCYVTVSTLYLQFGRFFIPENQFLHCCLSTEGIGSDSDSPVRIKHTFFFLTFRGPCIVIYSYNKTYQILQVSLVVLSYICMCTYLKDVHRTNKSTSSYKEGEQWLF